MTVWYHRTTIFNRRNVLRIAGLLALCVALITTLLLASVSHAVAGVNQTLSFQGRLMAADGSVVPDGYYNMQFKIYQDGDGTTAGDTGGTLKWTESYVNNSTNAGVQVTNGFFSVNLGSQNPFGTSVDWNQDTLWLSMNVAGSSASCSTFGTSPCTADGEMLPMKRITSTPYALNSGMLGGKTASDFIQNTTSPQTGDFNITGGGTANTLQGNTSVSAPLIDSTTTTLNIGTTTATTINIGSNNVNHTLNLATGNGNQNVNIATGSGSQTVVIGSTDSASVTTIQGGNQGVLVKSNGDFNVYSLVSGRNTITAGSLGYVDINLGSSQTFTVRNSTNSGALFQVSDTGSIYSASGTSFEAKGTFTADQGITIQGTGSYLTPGGTSLSTAINIPNYQVPRYGSVMAFGLPSNSDATARGLLVADARTGSHQASIGVLSPDESNILGLAYSGPAGDSTNTIGTLANTGNTLALQGNGLNLLTATNNSGQANVGIGNAATSGYALDVTGDVNSSSEYRINGNTALTSSSLTFGGSSASGITAASGQDLALNSDTNITINSNGAAVLSANTTNVKIGDNTGSPTLLTVDRAASAPTVDSSLLGSMYYDTTLGELQCYEASGWGNCSSSPDAFINLSPQYTNAVMHGDGIGTMTNDLCSDDLNINDGSSGQPTICGTHETYNYYNWTSTETTDQTRSIYVTYQLPGNFKGFVDGSTSLMARTDSADSTVSYKVYKNTASGLTACGTDVAVSTGAQTTWQKGTAASTSDPSSCSFQAGDSIVFKIDMTAKNSANAYVSTLAFALK